MHVRNTSGPERGTWAAFAKAARAGARISQAELARRLGIDRTTVYRWEAGSNRPESPELVVAFAYVLGIDPEEALAAAGMRPGVQPPREPTRERDEEIEMVKTDPRLDEATKDKVITLILERREREKAAAVEETKRMIELLRRNT